jgi:hypothetical protein
MFNWLSNLMQSYKQDEEARKNLKQDEAMVEYKAHRKTIDDYRHRFRISPCGRWSQAVGSFGCVMDEIWEFNPDRTGKIIETEPFGGIRGETLFEWQEVADLTIACKVIKWSYAVDEEDELEEYQTIRYDFKICPTDGGDSIGLCQVAADGTYLKGFWCSTEPLINTDNW